MTNVVINVEEIGKRYRLGRREYGKTLRDAITNAACAPFRRLKHSPDSINGNSKYFWALKDVSFDVERGEVLGIVGRNGSGKSTLLKILSRITAPTEGKAEIHGRVGSLLEVGTGFHAELTGRENIYLSGSILGMKKSEIDDKFDEIVKFSEVEKFLDTPVKRYSSGMHVRLAFAVAANLDPEILLIDEVLAVGDAVFQKKCLGKMRNVASEGRTVLFVSHNMGAVSQLCSRAILLDSGRISNAGPAQEVVRDYLNNNTDSKSTSWNCIDDKKYKNDVFAPLRLCLIDKQGQTISPVVSRYDEVYVELEFMLKIVPSNLTVGIGLLDQNGTLLFKSLHTDGNEEDWPKLRIGHNTMRMKLPIDILNEGDYSVALDCRLHNVRRLFNLFDNIVSVKFGIHGGLSNSPQWTKKREGIFAPVIQWELV
jgi:lipopolysaccharide transport system ATP-binding protein